MFNFPFAFPVLMLVLAAFAFALGVNFAAVVLLVVALGFTVREHLARGGAAQMDGNQA